MNGYCDRCGRRKAKLIYLLEAWLCAACIDAINSGPPIG